MSEPFINGRGTKVRVAKLARGSRDPIIPQTITTATTAVAAAATTVTVAALTEPIKASVANPVYLSFVDALTDTDRFVEVVADAADGATTLTIAPAKKGISVGSTAEYPALFRARTTANITPNIGNNESFTFDNDGFSDGVVSTVGYEFGCDGNFLPLDAGYRTLSDAVNNFLEVYAIIEMASPGDSYTKGYIYEGAAAVTALPLTVPSDNLVTASATLLIRGKPKITAPA